MKRHHIDIVQTSISGLLAAVTVWVSASGGEQLCVIFLAILLSWPVVTLGSVFVGWRRYTQRSILPAIAISFTCLAVIASVAVCHWPLRITYALSREAFDKSAEQIRAGEQLAMPQRIGLFKIRKAEVYFNGIVCLWTIPNPSGNTGFVQCGRDHVPFNLWSLIKLDSKWQFISED